MEDEFKARYSSTVFACDLSSDTRYIRCDFPQCSEHGRTVQAKPSWMLNTLKNVRILENHVGKEIHTFMKGQPLQCVFSESHHKIESGKFIATKELPIGTKKVLAVFNLKDSQSQLGEWLAHFLDAAFISEHGDKRTDFVVLTQDFISRYELMKSIANLEFLQCYSPRVEVTCVLSCHSSSQGQVFSCTPSDISKEHGFEEFCSLHDLTLSCQDTLGDTLAGIHVSSCFTLKLDCSHQDWPVDSSWFKNKLKCLVTGSVKEVYETGSQVCDVHILLSAVLNSPMTPLSTSTCGDRLQTAIISAQTESFPDLAMEMGLEILDKEMVDSKLVTPGSDDKVSPPILVNSEVFVVLLIEEGSNNAEKPSPSVLLSEAVTANLCTRQASDIQCSYMVVSIKVDKVSSIRTKSSLKDKLNDIPVSKCNVFFVVVSACLANPSTGLVDAVRTWSSNRGANRIYGIHFQEISALQGYYIKNRLKEEIELYKNNKNKPDARRLEHIPITGLVDNCPKNAHMAYPVLLYIIHLAIGENGNRQPRRGLPSGFYSKKPLAQGTSCWTLEEVYMETCYVLSGLSRKCSLQVLSSPVPSNTSLSTNDVTMETEPQRGVSVPVCRTVDDNVVTIHEGPSTSIRTETKPGCSGLNLTNYEDSSRRHVSSPCHSCHDSKPTGKQSNLSRKRSLDFKDDAIPDVKKIATNEEVDTLNSSGVSKDDLPNYKQADPEPDVIVIDDDCDDGNIESNSKGIQADLPPPDLRRNGRKTKRVNIPSSLEQQNRKTKKKTMATQSGENHSLHEDHELRAPCQGNSNEDHEPRAPCQGNSNEDHEPRAPCQGNSNEDHEPRAPCQGNSNEDHEPRAPCQGNSNEDHEPRAPCQGNSNEDHEPRAPCQGNSNEDHEPCQGNSNEDRTTDNQTQQSRCSLSREIQSTGDIPLLANVDEVLVSHYVLDLSVDFDKQTMTGCIFLFIDPASEDATKKSFHLCLDSTLVNIQSVSEVLLPDDFKIPFFSRTSNTDQPHVMVTESDSTNSINTVVEIIDDDDVPPSPDQSGISDTKPPDSSERNTHSELSLFQRLQRNYGINLHDNNSTPNDVSGSSVNIKESCSSTMDKEVSPAVHEEPCSSDVSKLGSSSTLPAGGSSTLPAGGSSTLPAGGSSTLPAGGSSTLPAGGSTTLPELLDVLSGKASYQQPLSFKGLKYAVYGWCVKVNKEGATGKAWPRCVCIKYHTSPEGQSLTWTKDQDGRPCVFSPGAYINNRSLMPCQEPPVAMSTWQAAICVPKGCMVYMSGCPIYVPHIDTSSDQVTHYYEMDTPLPCSTLALAAGWLAYREGPPAIVPTTQGSQRPIPCRVIAAPSLINEATAQLLEHLSSYLVEACKLLGPYPYDRLDLLILPRCFACMGLKSPNLAFLSQSILSSDGSLRVRVAHEVTHAWFGLLIGAKDWTEEWLSEGFATYLEDTVQSRAERWSELEDQQYREIRQVLRYRTLSAEMQVTDKDMQCLRPKRTKQNLIERAEESNDPPDGRQPAPSTIMKYKCSKKWTQVHYLKGYFLLIHMENMVGREYFEKFLHDYVQHYQGRLVTSEDFFDYFLQRFPMLDGAVQDDFIREWLESSGLPKCLRRKNFASSENVLVNQALQEFEFWRRQDATNKRTKSTKSKSLKEPKNFNLQSSEQIVLMLEKLLQREKLLQSTLRQLNNVYQFATRNAEIRHRWCELIVKQKYTAELNDVKHFLIEDQGMGIYLFGELIISGQGKQRTLAEEIFAEIGPEMDRCTFKTVSDMLEGVD